MSEQAAFGLEDPHGYGQEVQARLVVGPIVLGHVDEIHGEMGRPVPEFIPTRAELLAIVESHMRTKLAIEEASQAGEGIWNTDARRILNAERRIEAIVALIGWEEVDQVRAKVARQFRKPAILGVRDAWRTASREAIENTRDWIRYLTFFVKRAAGRA